MPERREAASPKDRSSPCNLHNGTKLQHFAPCLLLWDLAMAHHFKDCKKEENSGPRGEEMQRNNISARIEKLRSDVRRPGLSLGGLPGFYDPDI